MSSYLGYYGGTVASASTTERVGFLRRTYAHLAGAILAFVALETLLVTSGVAESFTRSVFSAKGGWIGIMVLFMIGGFGAQYLANARSNAALQYLGLGLYVVLYAVLFMPLMYIATRYEATLGKGVISQAAIITLLVFGGLTTAVFVTKKDFSFLGYGLMIASFMALGLIICSAIFGMALGVWFIVLMIGLMCAMILYQTSLVMQHYQTDEHVAASMALFGSIMTLFWYVLQLLMSTSSND